MSAVADTDEQDYDEYNDDFEFETENPEVDDDLTAATVTLRGTTSSSISGGGGGGGGGGGEIGQLGDDNASVVSSNSIHSNSSSSSSSSVASSNNNKNDDNNGSSRRSKKNNRNSEGNYDDNDDYGLNDNAPGHSYWNNSRADEINLKVTKIQSSYRGSRIRKKYSRNNSKSKNKSKNIGETKSNNDSDSKSLKVSEVSLSSQEGMSVVNSDCKVSNGGTGNTTNVAQNVVGSNAYRSGGNYAAINDNHSNDIRTGGLAFEGEAVKIQSAYRGSKTRRNIKAVASSKNSDKNSKNNKRSISSTPIGDSIAITKKSSKVISTIKHDRETSTDALTMLDKAVQTDIDREEIRQKESEIFRLNTEVLRLNTLLSKSAKLSDELALHKTFINQKDAEIARLNEVIENINVTKSKVDKSNDENSSMLADQLRASNEEIKDLRLSLERLSKTASGSGSGSVQSSPAVSPSKIDVHRAVLNGRDASRDVLAMQLEMVHLENKQLKNEVENLRDRSRLLSNNVKELFAIFSPDLS